MEKSQSVCLEIDTWKITTTSGYAFVGDKYQLCNAGCRVTRRTTNIGLPFFLDPRPSLALTGLALSPVPFRSGEGLTLVIVLSMNPCVPFVEDSAVVSLVVLWRRLRWKNSGTREQSGRGVCFRVPGRA